MKASEMTNEALAVDLENAADFLMSDDSVIMEAVARLRKADKQKSINKELVDENAALLAKLKVAEDALEASLNYHNSDELRKAQHKAKRAIAEIREKGDAK